MTTPSPRARRLRSALAVALLLLPCSFLPRAVAQVSSFKNLQVLPKNVSKAELKTIMKAQSKALGVDCDFCHTSPNMDTETKKKAIGRDMMRMVNEINAKYLKDAPVKVTCMTCHRGKERPEP